MRSRSAAVAAGVWLALAGPVAADNVLPGFDLFVTPAPTQGTSSWNFAVIPLPADFFAPGSDPFAGVVQFQGEPLGLPGGPWPTDTIVERQGTAILPGPPSSDTVPIEIVALNLVSCNPITVTYGLGSPELWDVRMTLTNTSAGTMGITHSVPDGGTFTSSLVIQPRFTFTRHGDLVERYTNRIDNLTQMSAVQWSHTAPDGAVTGPGTSNFFPGGEPGDPSGPIQQFRYQGSQFTWDLRLAAVPEPCGATMMAAGAALLAARRRRMHRD